MLLLIRHFSGYQSMDCMIIRFPRSIVRIRHFSELKTLCYMYLAWRPPFGGGGGMMEVGRNKSYVTSLTVA